MILSSIPPDEISDAQHVELRDEALASLIRADARVRNFSRFRLPSNGQIDVDLDTELEWLACSNESCETVIVPFDQGEDPAEDDRLPDEMREGFTHRHFSRDGSWLIDQRVYLNLNDKAKSLTRLRVWDVRKRKWVTEKSIPFWSTKGVTDSQGKLFLGAGDDAIHILTLPSCEEIDRSPPQFEAAQLALSPDGQRPGVHF